MARRYSSGLPLLLTWTSFWCGYETRARKDWRLAADNAAGMHTELLTKAKAAIGAPSGASKPGEASRVEPPTILARRGLDIPGKLAAAPYTARSLAHPHGKLPRLVSLVPERFEDGGYTGVPRFDWELRRALPEVNSVNTKLKTRAWLRWLAWREPDAIVITGNETSLLVPESLRTIVLHHGCAQTHFDRDPNWRGWKEKGLCRAQRAMYRIANRWFVSSARWTAEQFSQHYGVPLPRCLPSWVETIPRRPSRKARQLVLGDYRTFNKGSEVVERLIAACPKIEFRLLKCSYDRRMEVYGAADAYLCLSLSEGGSFAVSDAEATSLPLITTDVGNYLEYTSSQVIPWHKRDDEALVVGAIEQALESPRGPSFFEDWTCEKWRRAWRTLLEEVADVRHCEPLLGAGSQPQPRE